MSIIVYFRSKKRRLKKRNRRKPLRKVFLIDYLETLSIIAYTVEGGGFGGMGRGCLILLDRWYFWLLRVFEKDIVYALDSKGI